MFVNGQGRNAYSLQKTSHRCFLPRFGSFGQAISKKMILRNRPIRNKNSLLRPCLSLDWDKISNIYKGSSIDASYHVSVYLAKQFQKRIFKKMDQSEKRIAFGNHVLYTDRDEMCNRYRGPSIDASYPISQMNRLKCEKLTDDE